ncbi:MAG TPA: hypothetical protein VNM90_00790 [Haliangium sp.]|nr:hypothetical protein [Haliangium sp.]
MNDEATTNALDVFLDEDEDEEALAHFKYHEEELLSEDTEAEILRRLEAERDPARRERLERRRELLRMVRPLRDPLIAVREHIDQVPHERSQELGRVLIAFSQLLGAPDWAASEQHMREHADLLLGDLIDEAIDMVESVLADNPRLKLHRTLIGECRKHGIERAYADLVWFIGLTRGRPVSFTVIDFLCAEDEAEVERLMTEHGDVLGTDDARQYLEELLALARAQGDTRTCARAEERLALLAAQ